jgi:hypothetical protein
VADSTLTAVVIGGIVAGVPALLTARMHARSIETISRSERDEQRRAARAELYAEFVANIPSSEAEVAAMQEALLELELRASTDVPAAAGAGDDWNKRFVRLIGLLRFLGGSHEVREAAERLDDAYRDLINDLVEVLPSFGTATMDRLREYEEAGYAALDASSWQKRYDELVAAMRRDIDTV